MFKTRFIVFFIIVFVNIALANTQKVYFYTSDNNINNYKTLKINFEKYLKQFGDYEFQAFSDKYTFEKYLEDENIIVMLSSWHYIDICNFHNIKAKFVAKKNDTIKDTKVLVAKKGQKFVGTVATSYNKEYTNKILSSLNHKNINTLKVPKEIDALMSVGFGMSQFAIVSKDSFMSFSKLNPILAKDMELLGESTPSYRMLIASKEKNKKVFDIFTKMKSNKDGKKILDLLGLDSLVPLSSIDLKSLGGVK